MARNGDRVDVAVRVSKDVAKRLRRIAKRGKSSISSQVEIYVEEALRNENETRGSSV